MKIWIRLCNCWLKPLKRCDSGFIIVSIWVVCVIENHPKISERLYITAHFLKSSPLFFVRQWMNLERFVDFTVLSFNFSPWSARRKVLHWSQSCASPRLPVQLTRCNSCITSGISERRGDELGVAFTPCEYDCSKETFHTYRSCPTLRSQGWRDVCSGPYN